MADVCQRGSRQGHQAHQLRAGADDDCRGCHPAGDHRREFHGVSAYAAAPVLVGLVLAFRVHTQAVRQRRVGGDLLLLRLGRDDEPQRRDARREQHARPRRVLVDGVLDGVLPCLHRHHAARAVRCRDPALQHEHHLRHCREAVWADLGLRRDRCGLAEHGGNRRNPDAAVHAHALCQKPRRRTARALCAPASGLAHAAHRHLLHLADGARTAVRVILSADDQRHPAGFDYRHRLPDLLLPRAHRAGLRLVLPQGADAGAVGRHHPCHLAGGKWALPLLHCALQHPDLRLGHQCGGNGRHRHRCHSAAAEP